MTKCFFLLAVVMVITFVDTSTSDAQSMIQNDSPGKRAVVTTFREEPIKIETPTGTLFGTLEWPQSRGPVPVVLIIAGSGPTDRDGNSPLLKGANNSLKLLAEGLAANGVASVRYDKRGVGETGKVMQLAAEKSKTVLREDDLSFETYIDDAIQWGKQLRTDRRFSSFTILGHSEGSLIGMVAAQRIGADAYVSIAGAGRPVQQVILEQVKSQLPPDLLKATESILDQLASGKRVESVPPQLNALFRPSVQPYLISWFRYDPVKEIARLQIPILIVQGTTDIQASAVDPKALAGASPAAALLLIEGMNHVLKTVSNKRDEQVASYSDPTLPVTGSLISGISSFIIKVKHRSASLGSDSLCCEPKALPRTKTERLLYCCGGGGSARLLESRIDNEKLLVR